MYGVKKMRVPGEGIVVYKGETKLMEVLELGASLNFFCQNSRSLILGYSDLSASSLASCRSAILLPFPNRLDQGKYSFEGKSYQFPINEPANNNAIHGFVHNKFFKLSSVISKEGVTISGLYSYTGEYDYYPFPFQVEASYHYSGDGLRITHKITNSGDSDMPLGYGWHPYFSYPEGLADLSFTLEECEQMLLTERQLPTGELRRSSRFADGASLKGVHLDTGYRMPGADWEVKIESREGCLFVKGYNSRYLQLFTPSEGDSIAIEPMSCGIDVFNSGEGLQIITKGQSIAFASSINYTKNQAE